MIEVVFTWSISDPMRPRPVYASLPHVPRKGEFVNVNGTGYREVLSVGYEVEAPEKLTAYVKLANG